MSFVHISVNANVCLRLFNESAPLQSPHFSSVELNHYSGNDSSAEEIIGQYLDFQKKYYAEKLLRYSNISAVDRVKIDFQDALVRLRSEFLVLTKGPIRPDEKIEFLGGIRAVFSKDENEKLPLEFEHNVRRIPVNPGQVSVEIGRLTSLKGATKLIIAMLGIVMKNPDVQWIYVHTSKAHVRLYRRMGIATDRIVDIDEINQIMAFSREDAERVIKILESKSE